jgi:hypothetical protein
MSLLVRPIVKHFLQPSLTHYFSHNLFRRGGMKRHLTSKHPEHLQGTHTPAQAQDNHEDEDDNGQ